MTAELALIGAGAMGGAIGARFRATGHLLRVLDLDSARVATLTAQGAEVTLRLPLDALSPDALVTDLVYTPLDTHFLRAARARGWTVLQVAEEAVIDLPDLGGAERVRRLGVPVEGVCLYPILDHPGWDDDRLCPNGLLGHDPGAGARTVHGPLADRVQHFMQGRIA